ncbi:hypothetical protein [Ascidiimonas sp. W6]|uniref:hypothetical protein n=1 Tax=Ascidiimonas meishanensis TaxID=3128903 RepID=UPI0030EB7850
MFKKVLKFIVIIPFLVAFQCDEELESDITFNDYTVNITPQSSFSIDDTIWISGIVSSQAYDSSINDSIFYDRYQGDVLSIMKLIAPTELSNCIDAIDNFELIVQLGEISFFPRCENAEMTVTPELSSDNLSFRYRIGLKPLGTGDFVISWQNSNLQNENRNESIIDKYPIENHPNQIGFNKCGKVSWRLLDESNKEFYFSVE